MKKAAIDSVLKSRRIVVTCGTGGVGKTTLSAAMAVRAAQLGKKAVVITIDPAKRLATSLGMGQLGDEPTDLTPILREMTREEIPGTLAAIVPDTRQTFESFLETIAPSPAVVEQIKRNSIFQIFAKEFSGTNEYMALQKLYALEESGKFDCIILDTPPSRNMLAFLEAPQVLARFFDEKLIRWLVLPTNRLLATGMRKALEVLERLTGSGFMTQLFEFASALFEVRLTFTANLNRITELLGSPEVGFLMVSAPVTYGLTDLEHFMEALEKHKFNFDGVALNRTLGYLHGNDAGIPVAAREIIAAQQKRERELVAELGRQQIPLLATLPELVRDVHSLEDLIHVAMAFHAQPAPPHD